jgi:hypothetical protein
LVLLLLCRGALHALFWVVPARAVEAQEPWMCCCAAEQGRVQGSAWSVHGCGRRWLGRLAVIATVIATVDTTVEHCSVFVWSADGVEKFRVVGMDGWKLVNVAVVVVVVGMAGW